MQLITHNGPVVGLGAVRSALVSFLPVPADGAKLSCHGKTLLRMSPDNENGILLSRYIF
jgi:hypothetical protein